MMVYKDYIGDVEYDSEAKFFHGRVIGLKDVITFQGKSVKEIDKAFRESIDDYLEFCKKRNEKPDKPFSGKILLRTQPDLHRKLALIAERKRTSMNKVLEEAIERYLC